MSAGGLSLAVRHPWDLTPAEAIAVQRELAGRITLADGPEMVASVGGVDVGIRQDVARAAVAVVRYPELNLVTHRIVELPVAFPYVPGLLSFREAPAILAALEGLDALPDVLLFDGQGYAHPRRMGIATHLGILLDRPTIGCAKSRLCGLAPEPEAERGSYAWLRDGDEVIGAVVRTRTLVRPVYVSVGHRMRLERAIAFILSCTRGYRLPEPLRWAHRLASGQRSDQSPWPHDACTS
ncbi:MAG: deoxyribonuclease V [Chloroflexota bacterium]